jgi:hypothetical protein
LNRGCGDVWNSLVKVCFINNGDADGTDFAPVGRPDWLLCPVDCLRTYRPGLLILTAF